MSILQSIILALVQGLTELLPVSSSAHLKVLPWILGWTENAAFNKDFSGAFDVALHLGTLLAIIIFFIDDWLSLIKSGFRNVVKKEHSHEGNMFWYIVISTIPAGILALVLDKISEKIIGGNFKTEMLMIAAALIILGIVLDITDKKAQNLISYEDITFKQSLIVSLSQAVAAAFPGVSRSGITMTAARSLKIDRESSAKFSFMLSAPIVAAAVIFDFSKFSLSSVTFWIGVLTSFISGMAVIKFLLEFVKKRSFRIFAIYRIILGVIITALVFLR